MSGIGATSSTEQWLGKRDLTIAMGLFIATAVIFWPATEFGFTNYDDPEYVSQNKHVLAGLTRDSFIWSWTTGHAANWHPLTWQSLQLDTTLWGTDPHGYHRTNILLHALNAGLLYLVLRRTTGASIPSFVVAALFAFHSLRVESVVWISERKDVLSGFFGLLTIWAYLRYTTRPTWGRWFAVAAALAAGLASKPMLVSWPFVLLLLDFWPLNRLQSRADLLSRLREKWLLFTLVLASSIVTFMVQNSGGAVQDLEDVPLLNRASNIPFAYLAYMRMTILPIDLAVLYPMPVQPWPLWQAAGATLGLATITGLIFRYRKSAPFLLTGWLWFVGTLVPVIGLVQVGAQSHADRYTYLPQIGLLMAGVWSAAALANRWQTPPIGLALGRAALIVASIIATRVQMRYWRSDLDLWERDVAVAPLDNPVGYNNLGKVHSLAGDLPNALRIYTIACEQGQMRATPRASRAVILLKLGRLDEAEHDARISLTMKSYEQSEMFASWFVIAEVSKQRGQFDLAIRDYQESLKIKDNFASRSNLGNLLLRLGRSSEGIPHLKAAWELEPQSPEVNHNLGFGLMQTGAWEAALPYLQTAESLQPENVRYHVLVASTLCALGRVREAEERARTASRLDPRWGLTYSRMAWVLATDPDPRKRQGELALAILTAIRLVVDSPPPQLLDALAAANAESQRFDEAVALAQRAIAVAEQTGHRELVESIQLRLALYSKRIPYRTPPAKP